jgi:hypothetical protein
MKNLGEYIIPQIFTNIMIKYYEMDTIQNINTREIIDDLKEYYDHIPSKISTVTDVEWHRTYWRIRVYFSNDEARDLLWTKSGLFVEFREV